VWKISLLFYIVMFFPPKSFFKFSRHILLCRYKPSF
jgi:hypothetical protein